ncbi:MAG TPA: hydroxymethylglutaryl-CoA lyase, partial [Variovorax sp.]|nr:hydroxymethylglutaryl-CoA lyase [Variovorax sp.]
GTEDVVYLLQSLDHETGIDLIKLIAAGSFISTVLGRETSSRVARAMSAGASAISAYALS